VLDGKIGRQRQDAKRIILRFKEAEQNSVERHETLKKKEAVLHRFIDIEAAADLGRSLFEKKQPIHKHHLLGIRQRMKYLA
jgi:hypothetical protein